MEYSDLLPFRAVYANADAPLICVKCNDLIHEMTLCLSKSVKSSAFDEANSPWFHYECFFAPSKSKSRQRPESTNEIAGYELLRWQDRDKIHQKIAEASSGQTKTRHCQVKDNLDEYDLEDEQIPQTSKLEIAVQPLIAEIFQPQLQSLAGIQYQTQNLPKPDFMLNLDTMPWGRLRHGVITEACKVLKEVLDLLEIGNGGNEFDLDDLTYRFHQYIVKDFGSDYSLPVLGNPDPLFKIKLRVLKFFLDSVLGYVLLIEIDLTTRRHHPPVEMDLQYINLQCHITTVELNSEIGKLITKYFTNTNTGISVGASGYGVSHLGYGSQVIQRIENVFALERYDEDKRFEPYRNQTNRKLLWHASNAANFVGILSTGLRIRQARPGRFGSGIYFADAAAKSMGYTRGSGGSKFVFLLLCEVALGEERPYGYSNPTTGNCTKYEGGCHPDPVESTKLPNGTIVPCGKLVNYGREFNEYIVFNEAQVQLRYLVKIRVVL